MNAWKKRGAALMRQPAGDAQPGKGKEESEDGGGVGDADGEGGEKQTQPAGVFRIPAGSILFPAQLLPVIFCLTI